MDDNSDKSKAADKHEGLKSVLSTLAILIIAPLVALALTAFVFQSYEVDGPSMETTLQNHDRLIVYKLPRTIARITHHDYLPNRGDIVIFNLHEADQYGGTGTRQLIKRVIGLPGEKVVVKDGKYTVYNKEFPNGFNPDDAPYGKVIKTTNIDGETYVPPGHIFVSGDNRTNSLDSRSFGPVPLSDIVGKLSLRVFPLGKSARF